MMVVALMMRAWIIMLRPMQVLPRVLADDVCIIAKGSHMLKKLARALNATHRFCQDMGAKIAPTKSLNFATTLVARRWLEQSWWKEIQAAIPVVGDFRYLGAHVNTGGGGKTALETSGLPMPSLSLQS